MSRMDAAPLAQSTVAAHRVLLIDGDETAALDVANELVAHGFETVRARSGSESIIISHGGRFDVLVVDHMLPDLDGMRLIQQLRVEDNHAPALMLCALSAVDVTVCNLKTSGDDYLIKPFSPEELLARLQGLLQRPIEARENMLRVGPIVMNLRTA